MSADQEDFREKLRTLGFDEVRFAEAGEVRADYRDRYSEWLESGQRADMHWIDRSFEKRVDPDEVLPGVETIILLGINYLPDEDEPARHQERWAKYALYHDYHDTLKKALIDAGKLLETEYGLGDRDYRYYTDTGPLMERGWAARAGLGWQGKNGMLISRTHGNWLLLAAILVRHRFQPDRALENRKNELPRPAAEVGLLCGSCTRCIDACPTKAIVQNGIVDARLCISYQTIENKGIIPRELRAKIGNRIFGCDICLDVCPWNRFAQAGRRLLMTERYDLAELTLSEILTMKQEDFSRIFAKTPIKRLKWRGLLRNAAIVAGNLRDFPGLDSEAEIAAVIPHLISLVTHDLAMVRVHAIWAIHRLAPEKAAQFLAGARAEENDPVVLEEYAFWGM